MTKRSKTGRLKVLKLHPALTPSTPKAQGLFRYTISHAPWAVITSLTAGVQNYIILILLAKHYGAAAGGQFRLLLSVFGILSLFTLMDSGKVAIKYLVRQEPGVVRPLLRQRVLWSLAGLLIGLITAAVYYYRDDEIWLALLIMALCVPVARPSGLFAQINQAKKQFRLNAIYNLTKSTTVVIIVSILAYFNSELIWIFSVFFILWASFNALFLLRHHETFEPDNPGAGQYKRESRQLSASGIFPILLGHADKFLVSYFYDLETLGIYVIGVSTGRLLLNFVKPCLSIYLPMFVKHRVPWFILIVGFTGMTLCGLLAYFGLDYYFDNFLGAEYLDAAPLSFVIISGLGVYFVGVVVYYSAVYHEDSVIKIPAITNVVTAVLMVSYMIAVLKFGGDYALILCAASYPLREFINLVVIKLLEARMKPSLSIQTLRSHE